MFVCNDKYREIEQQMLQQAKLICKKCGSKCNLRIKNGVYVVRCTWKHCGSTITLWSKTVLENSKITFLEFLAILDLWLMNMPLHLICKLMFIDRKTLRRLLSNVSSVLVPKYYSSIQKIVGNNVEVEVDESKFGKRKYHRGHRVDGVWVLGMVERTTSRRIVVIPVNDRSRPTLSSILHQYVEKDSVLLSDCWKAYANSNLYFKSHNTVNHSIGFKNSLTGTHTNTIEGTWCAIKSQTPVRCRTRALVSLYLVRFMLKRNEAGRELTEVLKYLF